MLQKKRMINLFQVTNWTRGPYWGILARGRGSEVRTKTTEGQYSPVRSWASEVSKRVIIWHHFRYETTLPVVHSRQGKKPAILTGFRISLMIVAVDRQKQGRGKQLPIDSLKWNPNDVLTTCKAICEVLVSGSASYACADVACSNGTPISSPEPARIYGQRDGNATGSGIIKNRMPLFRLPVF